MLKTAYRLFSSGTPVRNSLPVKIQPTWAARQIIAEDASKSKQRTLRRKEVRLKKQIVRDVNNFKKYQSRNLQFEVDPVLGDSQNKFMKEIRDTLQDQENRLAYGYDRVEFEKLLYGAEKVALDKAGPTLRQSTIETEEKKKRALLTILNVKNTNASDRRSSAISLARKEFQRHEGDTASPEVQAAVMTVKIHFGMDHVKQNPKDKDHTQIVRQLVQQRQSILKYLKKDKPETYYFTISKLGLTDDVVEREFNMGRQYFQDFKVWGDKQLINLSDKQQRKVDKITDLQKRVSLYNEVAKEKFALLKDEDRRGNRREQQ